MNKVFENHKIVFGDVKQIQPKPDYFIFPKQLENNDMLSVFESMYTDAIGAPSLTNVLCYLGKQYWANLLSNAAICDQDDLADALTMVVKNTTPSYISHVIRGTRIVNLNDSCYVKLTLSFAHYDSDMSPTSVTAQLYGIFDETRQLFIPTHDAKTKQQITKKMSADQDQLTVEKFLSNSKQTTYGKFGIHRTDGNKFRIGSIFGGRMSRNRLEIPLIIPKMEVTNKNIKIGGYMLGEAERGGYRREEYITNINLAEFQDKPVCGAKFEKGLWKSSQDKNSLLQMTKEEALEQLHAFLAGSKENKLLCHMVGVLCEEAPFYLLEPLNVDSENNEYYILYCKNDTVHIVARIGYDSTNQMSIYINERLVRRFGINSAPFLEKCKLLVNLVQ